MLDLHVDFVIQKRLFGYNPARRHRRGFRGQPLFWHADVPRMIQAGYVGACLGMHYFPWESERGWRELGKQLDVVDALGEIQGVRRAFSSQDWGEGVSAGELVLAPGVEGAHMLNKKLERVELLAGRGVAYMTLVHLGSNSAATTSWGLRANDTSSLSDFGVVLVGELERHGILVDLAHVNHPGIMHACEVATKPLMCTHIGVRALHDHPRNLRDDAIDAIAETGGVIGIIFCPKFLTGKFFSPARCIAEHARYIAERVGVQHVAMGSDFDGWVATIPSDMRDCLDVVKVRQALREVGFSPDEVEDAMWRNAQRVLVGASHATTS